MDTGSKRKDAGYGLPRAEGPELCRGRRNGW